MQNIAKVILFIFMVSFFSWISLIAIRESKENKAILESLPSEFERELLKENHKKLQHVYVGDIIFLNEEMYMVNGRYGPNLSEIDLVGRGSDPAVTKMKTLTVAQKSLKFVHENKLRVILKDEPGYAENATWFIKQ